MKGYTNAHGAVTPMEKVLVNVTSDNGVLPNGFIITITDNKGTVLATTGESSYSISIPYDTEYIVSASSVDGYITPANQIFTASQPSRNVDVTYSAALNGVFVQDIYGRLYTEDEWDGTQTANGIAVLTDECQFVVALNDISYTSYWGGSGTDISTLSNYSDCSSAATDFDGVGNTAKIIAAIGSTNDGYRSGSAAGDCVAYTFPNGKTGYLGAAGEWGLVNSNIESVTSLLRCASGALFAGDAYWTSTELSSTRVWTQWFDGDGLDDANKKAQRTNRALTPYIANPKIISFTITGTKGTFQFQAIEGSNSKYWNQSVFCPTDDIYGYIGNFSTAWDSGFIIEDGGAYRFSGPY